jgi:hypothetical protein
LPCRGLTTNNYKQGVKKMVQQKQKKKTGPKPKPKSKLRQHPITCRVTDSELEHIDTLRCEKMTRGEFIRTAALKRKMPKKIEAINIKQWNELAKLANNINQLARVANANKQVKYNDFFNKLYKQIQKTRKELIGG